MTHEVRQNSADAKDYTQRETGNECCRSPVCSCVFCSYAHLDIYHGLNSNLNRQHHRLESRYSSSSGGSYEEEKSKRHR